MNQSKPKLILKLLIKFMFNRNKALVDKDDSLISKNAEWFDDYYAIEYIDKKTIAISEPRYYQKNFNYLIIGKDKAIVFDTGPGIRNIETIVKKLTKLPIIYMFSHYHFDHVGNVEEYDNVILSKIQIQNQSVSNKKFTPVKESHMGSFERIKPAEITYKKLLNNFDEINLGNRIIQIIETPGHAKNSISLLDKKNKQLFTGDFIYDGPIVVHPKISKDGCLDEYIKSISTVLNNVDKDIEILGAHSKETNNIPRLKHSDLVDMDRFFKMQKPKSKFLPKNKKINLKINIIY